MSARKSIFASKIFWVNIIALLIGLLELFTPNTLLGLGAGPDAQVKALAIIGAVTGVLNIVLRILSGQQVDAGAIGALLNGMAELFKRKK